MIRYITLQLSKNCNLNCKYCYLGSHIRESNSHITIENAKSILDSLHEYSLVNNKRKIKITLHGGEPLLLGRKFFNEFFDHANSLNNRSNSQIFYFSIQTNITLLDDDYCKLFKENSVNIGTSLDGPCELHDINRIFKNGRTTHKSVMKGIDLAKKHDIKVGAICIITKKNVEKIEEIYNFFKQNEINFKTNSLFMCGGATKNRNILEITDIEYATFLNRLFDLWYHDSPQIVIDNLFFMLGIIIKNKPTGSCDRFNCSSYHLTITPSGNCYTCGRTTQNKEFLLGNILNNKLFDIFSTEKFNYLSGRVPENISECKSCELARLCGSGCMYEAYLKSGDIYSPDRSCSSFFLVYNHIAKAVNESILIKENNNESNYQS